MFINNSKFKGVIPPLAAPLTPDEKIDEKSLRKLIDHTISGGVHGIFILGTTGEGMRITDKECERAIQITINHLAGRAILLVGCSDFGTQRTIEKMQKMEKEGIDAFVVTPSYFLPGYTSKELISHYTKIAQKSSIPIFIYNLPINQQPDIEVEALDEISKIDNIAGVKDSSQDMDHLMQVIGIFKDRKEFRTFVGTEVYMVECIQAGAHGCVPSIGNVVPEICAKLYDAIIDGNDEKIEILKKQMLDARKRVYTSGKSWFSYVSGIKSKLNEKGITGTKMAEPFVME